MVRKQAAVDALYCMYHEKGIAVVRVVPFAPLPTLCGLHESQQETAKVAATIQQYEHEKTPPS